MRQSMDVETANTDFVPLLGNQVARNSKFRSNWVLITLLVIIFAGSIIATVFITKAVVENNNDSSEGPSQTSASPTIEPTMEPTSTPNIQSTTSSTTTSTTTTSTTTMEPTSSPTDYATPKNLIIIVSDGMGQTYNAAYRTYKNLTRTTIDKHFKGRYTTKPLNSDGITDSAAGATVFACGVPTRNAYIAVDGDANPKGSILAAAKRQGKGTGIVVTKSVTDATPAAFSAHSWVRSWNELISKQQTQRQINGEPMLDVLFGGGRRYFERWGFFDNDSIWDEYGWNTVTDNTTEFIQDLDYIDIDEMPYMGLFADGSFPYYLDRIHGDVYLNDSMVGEEEYPTLMQMSEKAINLLSTKYKDEGFFLLIEASEVDLCGHANDIVCMLWEMEEFMTTTEWVLEWAANDTQTLVVMLSDHETGGMAIGRDGSYYDDDLISYLDGTQPRNGDVAEAWYSFDNAYGIAPPSDISSFVNHYGAYKWKPEAIKRAKHTADWFKDETGSGGSLENIEQIYQALSRFYIGDDEDDIENNGTLTDVEKEFIESAMSRSSSTRRKAVAMLMNARTMTGWTTHGHSGADVAVHAFGPGENEFIGHWYNWEIGLLMIKIFDVEDEVQQETQYLQELFINGTLEICDPNVRVSYVEWQNNVTYPPGNLKAGQYCVEEWL